MYYIKEPEKRLGS